MFIHTYVYIFLLAAVYRERKNEVINFSLFVVFCFHLFLLLFLLIQLIIIVNMAKMYISVCLFLATRLIIAQIMSK